MPNSRFFHPDTVGRLGFYQNRLFAHAVAHPIFTGDAVSGSHGIRSKDAYERAVIVLRMLVAEADWSDGFERKLDDCFEMGDGAEVTRHLLDFCSSDPRILRLLATHRSVGQTQLDCWRERAEAARVAIVEPV